MKNSTYPSANQANDDVPISVGCVVAALVVLSLLFPSLSVVMPQIAYAIDEQPPTEDLIEFTSSFGYQADFIAHNTDTPEHWNELFERLIRHYVAENDIRNPQWPARMEAFMAMTSHIESDNKRSAHNPSGAMSYYQFKGPSLQTAYVRLTNYLYRHDLGRSSGWSKAINNSPTSIYNYSKDKQAVFVLANILGLDKNKHLLADFLNGDTEIAKEIYYKYHHTKPDRGTIVRTERLFDYYFSEL